MKIELHKVIKKPIVTEKSTVLRDQFRKVSFEVQLKATKPLIKAAIEKAFDVKVTDVQTMVVHSRKRRVGRFISKSKKWKKAIVTLREGDNIPIVEGV
ncbi:MAG: 50S ribosomal protein L23 [Bdellovibrionales bacterium]|nr:50S ribosomal protein L23 [Bdellovibrionales bacterium]